MGVEKEVLALGQNADAVARLEGNDLAWEVNFTASRTDKGDFFAVGVGAPCGVGGGLGRELEVQKLHAGADGGGGDHVINGGITWGLDFVPIGFSADQILIGDVAREEVGEGNAQGLGEGLQNAEGGVAQIALELAECGGAESCLLGEGLDCPALTVAELLQAFTDGVACVHVVSLPLY